MSIYKVGYVETGEVSEESFDTIEECESYIAETDSETVVVSFRI